MRCLASRTILACLIATCGILACLAADEVQSGRPAPRGRQPAARRRNPPVVEPADGTIAARPPKDAIILFDGSSLDAWKASDGRPAKWRVADGYLQTTPGVGPIETKA